MAGRNIYPPKQESTDFWQSKTLSRKHFLERKANRQVKIVMKVATASTCEQLFVANINQLS